MEQLWSMLSGGIILRVTYLRENLKKNSVCLVEVLPDGGGRLWELKDLVPFLDLPSAKVQPRYHTAFDRTTKAQMYFYTS